MGDKEENRWPPWLKPLLKEEFFVQCKFHEQSPKRVCNMYCLDCTNDSLCSHCLNDHNGHRTVQIRRFLYHDVIEVNEIKEYLDDISNIQTYVTNKEKVVFLNERTKTKQSRPSKAFTNTCEVCNRGLVDDYFRFCSIACMVAGTSRSFEKREKQTLEPESQSSSSGVENNRSNLQSSSNPQSSPELSSSNPQSSPELPSSNPQSSPELPTSSFRERPRKGFPQRSPLQ